MDWQISLEGAGCEETGSPLHASISSADRGHNETHLCERYEHEICAIFYLIAMEIINTVDTFYLYYNIEGLNRILLI